MNGCLSRPFLDEDGSKDKEQKFNDALLRLMSGCELDNADITILTCNMDILDNEAYRRLQVAILIQREKEGSQIRMRRHR